MGKKSAPAAPDYTATAREQASQQQDLLTQNTWANRVDQSNPWGQQSWNATQSVDPVTGKPVTKWGQTTTLDPEMQRALDANQSTGAGLAEMAQGRMGQMQGQFGQPMDTSGFTAWGKGPQ